MRTNWSYLTANGSHLIQAFCRGTLDWLHKNVGRIMDGRVFYRWLASRISPITFIWVPSLKNINQDTFYCMNQFIEIFIEEDFVQVARGQKEKRTSAQEAVLENNYDILKWQWVIGAPFWTIWIMCALNSNEIIHACAIFTKLNAWQH